MSKLVGFKSTPYTTACKCEKPILKLMETQRAKSGKHIGRVTYTYYCYSCKALFRTRKKLKEENAE